MMLCAFAVLKMLESCTKAKLTKTFNFSWREEDLKNCAYLWKNLASPPDYGVSIC